MIDARYDKLTRAYYINMSTDNLTEDIPMKFDTGAAYTVLSLTNFTKGERNIEAEDIIRRQFEAKGIEPLELYAANGGRMLGYPVCIPNVRLGSEQVKIKDFWYCLVIEIERQTKLLEDDFISCCGFSHNPGSNILISTFDTQAYYDRIGKIFENRNILLHSEILEMVDENRQ